MMFNKQKEYTKINICCEKETLFQSGKIQFSVLQPFEKRMNKLPCEKKITINQNRQTFTL